MHEYFKTNVAATLGITENDLCRWDTVNKVLRGSQKAKALKFNRLGLIKPGSPGIFHCMPIPGYNSSMYTMDKNDQGEWQCNCQWNVKNNLYCSHLQALFLWLKNKGDQA